MLIKILVGGLLLFMVFNLFKAMMIMLKDDPNSPPMSKFIGRRVLTSAIIVGLILLAVATGLITPNPTPLQSALGIGATLGGIYGNIRGRQ